MLPLPLSPRFITLTLVTLAMLAFAVAVAFEPGSHVLRICFTLTFADLYPALGEGQLLSGALPQRWSQPWAMADPHSFRAVA